MQAGAYDRLLIRDPEKQIVAIGIGTGGGADHSDTMVRLAHTLGVPFGAETIADARVAPARVQGKTTLYDFRDKGLEGGTVFALNYAYSEIDNPISLDRLLKKDGRTSLYQADENPERPTGLVTAWMDNTLVIVAHHPRCRDILVEMEAALRRG